MNEVVQTINNDILPIITIENIILEKDKVFITFKAVANQEINIGNFTSQDYFKYLEIVVNCGGVFETVSITELPITRNIVLNVSVTGETNVSVASNFSINKIIEDFSLVGSSTRIVYNLLGSSNTTIYPLTDTDTNLVDPVIQDGIEIPTKVIDYRYIEQLDSFDLITPTETDPTTINNTVYFISLGSSTYGKVLTTFVEFNFKQYLENNSYFKNEEFNDFSISIVIGDQNIVIDNIILTKTKNSNVNLISNNNKTKILYNNNNGKILFYFTEEFTSSQTIDKSYILKVTYVDKTYTNFYNSQQSTGTFFDMLNDYTKLKNLIFIGKKYNAYLADPIKPNPFYLILDNERFTDQFVSFCNRQQFLFNPNDSTKITIDEFTNNTVESLITNINKFAKVKISDLEKEAVKKSLLVSNTTLSVCLDFFKIMDVILSTIQKALNSVTLTNKTYTKTLPITKTEICQQYYVFDTLNFSNSVPTYSIDKFKELIKNIVITPRYFYSFGKFLEISNNIDFDDETFNTIKDHLSTANNKKRSRDNAELVFGEELFSQYSISYSKTSHILVEKELPRSTTTQFSNVLTTKKSLSPTQNLKISDITKLDKDVLSTIKQSNRLLTGVLLGKPVTTIKKEEISPILRFFYWEKIDSSWKYISGENLSIIRANLLIKAVRYITSDSLLNASKTPVENLHLDSNYFILGKP
jgi:hypothetical protein